MKREPSPTDKFGQGLMLSDLIVSEIVAGSSVSWPALPKLSAWRMKEASNGIAGKHVVIPRNAAITPRSCYGWLSGS